MRNRTRLRISTSVLVIMIGAIFFVEPRPSSAQNDGFVIYELLVFCGDSGLPTAIFGYQVTEGGTQGRPLMGTWTKCVGKCGRGGTVSLADALAGLPAAVSAALQAKVDKHQADAAAGKGRPLACLGNGKKPPEEKKPDCREKYLCCDNVPGRGMLYAGTKDGRIYSEPSTNSTLVGSPPSGTRLRYTNTTQVNGQTWYYIESPGPQRQGWMSGSQLSCTRPVEPPGPKIIRPLDSDFGNAPRSTTAQVAGGRG